MFQLLNSLRLWVSNDKAAKSLTEIQLEQEAQILEERLGNLDSALRQACDTVINEFTHEIQNKVYSAYANATTAARARADDTVRKWGSAVNREVPAAGGLHFKTYKAVVTRKGCFTNAQRCHNFNEQLLEPLIHQLAGPWETVFVRLLPVILDGLPVKVSHAITAFHNDIEQHAVRNGASVASFEILKQQIPLYLEKVKVAGKEAEEWTTEKQRTFNREFEPLISDYMSEVYAACANESGIGCYLRMKSKMEQFVQDKKTSMFDNAANHVDGLIKKMLKKLRKKVIINTFESVFKDVKREYESVVLRRDLRPQDQRTMCDKVLEIVDGAELVFKRAVGLESGSAPEPESQMQRRLENAGIPILIKKEPGGHISKSNSEEGVDRDSTKCLAPGWLKQGDPMA